MSDAHFVAAVRPAAELVEAVHAGDVDAVRSVICSRPSEEALWALLVAVAAMVTDPDPERVLEYACDVDTRMTYSTDPESWPIEDLQTALAVSRLHGDPEASALWVRRGVTEWRRRRLERDAQLKADNAAALAGRSLRAAS